MTILFLGAYFFAACIVGCDIPYWVRYDVSCQQTAARCPRVRHVTDWSVVFTCTSRISWNTGENTVMQVIQVRKATAMFINIQPKTCQVVFWSLNGLQWDFVNQHAKQFKNRPNISATWVYSWNCLCLYCFSWVLVCWQFRSLHQ